MNELRCDQCGKFVDDLEPCEICEGEFCYECYAEHMPDCEENEAEEWAP